MKNTIKTQEKSNRAHGVTCSPVVRHLDTLARRLVLETMASEPAAHIASIRKRSSFTVSEAGGASTDDSSTASPTTPQESTDRSTTALSGPSSSSDRGCSSTTARSPQGSGRWGWSRKPEIVQPSTSPGNSLWSSSKDPVPKFDTKLAAKSKRRSDSGSGGGRTDGTSKSLAGGRSPADAAHQGAPPPLWTPHLTDYNPAPSPAGPYAESGEAPPVLASGKSPGIKASLKLPGEHSPVPAPPPSATSVGRGVRPLRGKSWGPKTPLTGAHGPRIASTGTAPVKIERACSDGRKSEVGRKGGKFAQSSPRAVPKGDADRAGVGGHGHGRDRSPVSGGWPRPSSSLETPGGLTGLQGDKLDAPLRRPRMPLHNPHSQESAGTIGPLVEQSQPPTWSVLYTVNVGGGWILFSSEAGGLTVIARVFLWYA